MTTPNPKSRREEAEQLRMLRHRCQYCFGTGERLGEECIRCDGTGFKSSREMREMREKGFVV